MTEKISNHSPKNGYEVARNLARGELAEAQRKFRLLQEQIEADTYTGDMNEFMKAKDRLNLAYQRVAITSALLELGTKAIE